MHLYKIVFLTLTIFQVCESDGNKILAELKKVTLDSYEESFDATSICGIDKSNLSGFLDSLQRNHPGKVCMLKINRLNISTQSVEKDVLVNLLGSHCPTKPFRIKGINVHGFLTLMIFERSLLVEYKCM